MAGYERLFDGGELYLHFRWRLQHADNLLRAIPQEQFLNARPDEIVDHLVSQIALEPLTLRLDESLMNPLETVMDMSQSASYNPHGRIGSFNVNAIKVVIRVPFTGHRALWFLKPSTAPWDRASAFLLGKESDAGFLELQAEQPADAPPQNFLTWKERELGIIRRYLEYQREEIGPFNNNLPSQMQKAVSERRERLQRTEGLQAMLGIPLRRNPDAPSVTPVQMTRRMVRPLPPPPKSGFQAEPGIEEGDYLHILSVIRHEGRTYETKPATFAIHDEEGLRDVLLAHLNGHYQGEATSETFRGKGKTDICIEDGSRAAFIAECKVWKGQKEFLEAIDQLLGYLTWRDCKTALVVFNKHNAKFSGILDTVPETFATHPLHRATTNVNQRGEWQFQMTSAEDEGRQLRVHVFVFDLYVK